MLVRIEAGQQGEAWVGFEDGGSIEVRDFNPLCSWAGDLKDGETMTTGGGCTATRRGGKVVWTEPLGSNLRAAAVG